ncbi:MAG: efflux RND transporter periplasmic adaptor subunit [Vicinamibacteraceae bacterium]
MTRLLAFVLIAPWALIGCRRAAEPSAAKADAPEAASEAAEGHGNATEVRIEPGMLRDLRITTAKVESRRGDEQVTLLGELGVDEGAYAEAGVSVAARIVRLRASLGESVQVDQALMELQSQAVGQARAEYLTATARQTLADSALTRKLELAAERIAPQREVQEAEAEAAAARAAVRAASAALHAIGVGTPEDGQDAARASFFTLRSPVSGTVIERKALQGQMLEPGTPAFRIANLSTLWLTVHAFERDALRIRKGAAARVTFAALPGEDFSGQVALVGGQVSTESRTIDVRIAIRNRAALLRPGMSATATVPIGVSDTPILAVPVAAVQRVSENWCVFLPKAAGLFEIRRIGRGRDLGTEVEVVSGLKAEETIVVDGAFLLKSQAEKSEAGHEDH